jgi:hypothetical protein
MVIGESSCQSDWNVSHWWQIVVAGTFSDTDLMINDSRHVHVFVGMVSVEKAHFSKAMHANKRDTNDPIEARQSPCTSQTQSKWHKWS